MSGIGGNEPTRYNYAAADNLKSQAEDLASALDGQAGSRSRLVSAAMGEFRGYYSEVFSRNADVARRSRSELASSLRTLAGYVTELKQAAEQEDQRREDAKAWEERQRRREESLIEGAKHEVASWFGGGDDPAPPAPEPAPQLTADGVSVTGRDIPAPAGGSSTSSAVPEDLRSFETGIKGLDDDLATGVRLFKSALSSYEAYCNGRWGWLNGQPVKTAVNDWLSANATDAQWAGEVAGAFEAAGGSGSTTVANASISATLASAGVNAHRDDFSIEPFSAIGTPPTTGFADDPVNTATGNFLEPETDMVFVGASASLEFTRMYNSLDDRTGLFGLGWSSILDTRLEFTDDGASFVMADGRQIDFPRAGTGWDRGVGENYWLHEAAGAQFSRFELGSSNDRVLVVTDNDGSWWAFTPAGTWLGSGRGPGSTIVVARDADGQITQLAHERGRYIDVEYTGDRVASISASDGRRFEYFYDEARRLISVTDSVGSRRYRWNDANLIDQVTAADGVVECENFYDDKGRVIRQLTPYGRSVRFAYLRGRVTSVSTDDGTGANTWIADRKGRVVGIVDADGNRQSMAYDPHGNIVSSTDRDGQVTVHAYDNRGRKVRTVTPDGADFTYGYDDFDRVTTVVTATGGVVEYSYDDNVQRNPSIITDPMGGRSELSWNNGQLTRVVDPEGVTVSLTYDAFGELVGVHNANGDTAELVRDSTGRIVEAVSPTGQRTKFRYAHNGLLVAREDADGSIWRFEHRDGGKVTAVVDPYGHRTEVEYGSHGEISQQIDPLGRVTTQEFDEFGNLTTMTLADGAQWSYTHDALSRLREVIDPAGGTWSYTYDVTGQLLSSIDPTGVRTDISRSRSSNVETLQTAFEQFTLRTDEHGRLIESEQSDGSAELISYDAAGRPVEFVDAEGGLTKLEYNLAGRITQITTPEHRTMQYEYDACGRPSVAIDPAGGRTVLAYDAASRVISRTSPAGEVSTIDYDAMGRITRETIPGVGVARYRYDKLGRLVGVQDSRYGQRMFAYDAAGQLVKATNGLGGVTRFEYDQRGRVSRMVDPTGNVTAYTYTEMDRITSVTDPLKRVTEATYDAAGRILSKTDPDGTFTQWTYDAAGREETVRINGQVVTQIMRDAAQRKTTVQDTTTGTAVQHDLTYNRRGQLLHRVTTQGDHSEEMSWEYDRDGYRRGMTTTDGTRVTYDRDRTGRIERIKHSSFGEVTFEHDADGKTIQARAGDLLQSWEYANGYPVQHTETTEHGTVLTRIVRDAQGRIVQLDGPNGSTRYEYDQACQLTAAVTEAARTSWSYDQAGRITKQTTPSGEHLYVYDQAGQLLLVKGPEGAVTTYEYDGQGQRILEVSGDNTTKYTWDGRGWLSQITEHHTAKQRSIDVSVNALGELTDVDDVRLHWDYAAGVPSLLTIGDTAVYQGPAGLTGVSEHWSSNGWRAARANHELDPWQTLASVSGRTAGAASHGPVGLAADGNLHIAGLEWMGARAYDAGSNSFLSMDPIAAPLGAAWAANPYSYAGNDPLHAIDPHGLEPLTDAELQEYADGLQGPMASALGAAGDWWSNNWEYVVGGVAIVAGVALMATGVGGPAGVAMAMAGGAAFGGGVSAVSQKAQHGEVDPARVATDALIGGISGGAAGYTANSLRVAAGSVAQTTTTTTASTGIRATAAQAGRTALTNSTHRAAIAGAHGGATSNTLNYWAYGENQTVGGYFQAAGAGALTGAAGSYGSAYLSPVTRNLGASVNLRQPVSGGGRHAASYIDRGAQVGNFVGDGFVGAASSGTNELLAPGETSSPEMYRALGTGFLSGGGGPSVSMHRNMSDWTGE